MTLGKRLAQLALRIEDCWLAVFMLPIYCMGTLIWWHRYKKWVFPNVIKVGRAATSDWLCFAISFVVWMLVIWIPLVWSAYGN